MARQTFEFKRHRRYHGADKPADRLTVLLALAELKNGLYRNKVPKMALDCDRWRQCIISSLVELRSSIDLLR
ncbi:hypothetical protein PAXRUDRAFT_832467 [Paxillus rubicundulus Ve08.2h10]|uniref:Unplaced genomic scaffold scaffold_871, whole genome shotgun sequence n=1 Tax=Paxillus rubicundulus Ve08.2h10 TaxID=930991 RepID=A0A0D0DR43_9AGAM|nr:hypothetical protein PAXRUDRAFT_832467 [Paxillus rubicundulus Ve08.2h10]